MTSNVLSQRSDPRFDTSTGPCEQTRDLASEPNQASPSSLSPKEFLIDKVTIAPPLDSDLGGVASPALSLILVEVGSLTLTIGGQVKTATSGDIVLWSHADDDLRGPGAPVLSSITWTKPHAASLRLHGAYIAATDGVAQFVATQLKFLSQHAPNFSQREIDLVGQTAFALIQLATAPLPMAPMVRSHLDETIRFIDQHLGSENLGPATIAKEIGLSRAKLYRLFAPHGGVTAFIQSRRLDRCFDLLKSGKGKNMSVATLAYRHGFVSKAHFSRRFKLRFGMSPRDVVESATN